MSDYISRELEKMDLPEAARDIIENLQSRAKAAEQERDKLLEEIKVAQSVLLQVPGAMTFENVAGMLNIVLEGRKPDATE